MQGHHIKSSRRTDSAEGPNGAVDGTAPSRDRPQASRCGEWGAFEVNPSPGFTYYDRCGRPGTAAARDPHRQIALIRVSTWRFSRLTARIEDASPVAAAG